MNKGKIILGIDPGTNLLGFGVIRVNGKGKPEFVDAGVLDLRKEKNAYQKLVMIRRYVSEACDNYKPEHLAIESPFMGKMLRSFSNWPGRRVWLWKWLWKRDLR